MVAAADNRVRIFDNRVEITLTDSGIPETTTAWPTGRISDPGGIAIVRNLDTVAPFVTGQASSQPNANGWVRQRCHGELDRHRS